MKKKNNTQKGFTLLETLVAIFILTLSITGPVYIASVAFRNTIDSRDNISAQYLAEEVIEVIKNKRDKEALTQLDPSSSWLNTILGNTNTDCVNNLGDTNNKCTMTRSNLGVYVFNSCGSGACPNIPFDPEGDFNVYGEADVQATSKFTREFYIEKETLTGLETVGVKLVVNIKWNDKGRDKIYTLTERLYNINYGQFFKD
jgi:prepilin-type N-terminal cleavage/methylation domain-containing protein